MALNYFQQHINVSCYILVLVLLLQENKMNRLVMVYLVLLLLAVSNVHE